MHMTTSEVPCISSTTGTTPPTTVRTVASVNKNPLLSNHGADFRMDVGKKHAGAIQLKDEKRSTTLKSMATQAQHTTAHIQYMYVHFSYTRHMHRKAGHPQSQLTRRFVLFPLSLTFKILRLLKLYSLHCKGKWGTMI